MASLPKPDNRLYLGLGGSGKSTLARLHAEQFHRVLMTVPDDGERPPYPATSDRKALVAAMLRPAFRIAYVCNGLVSEWEWANEAAWHAGETLVVWEEAADFMNGGRLRTVAPFAHQLWVRGRHRRNRVFACSQRPAAISGDCRANLSRAVIFQSTEPNDLKWYRQMISGEAVDRIRSLDSAHYEAVDWNRKGWAVKRAPFA